MAAFQMAFAASIGHFLTFPPQLSASKSRSIKVTDVITDVIMTLWGNIWPLSPNYFPELSSQEKSHTLPPQCCSCLSWSTKAVVALPGAAGVCCFIQESSAIPVFTFPSLITAATQNIYLPKSSVARM